jgi:NADPH:quinone reductase-like Zn-dependent oxidoreductase
MKAVRIQKPEGFEGIEGLVYEDAPDPQPAIGDALVQVRAASFTPTELTWPLRTDRAGHERASLIPAHEGSGVVVALGYGAAGVSVGDEVFGLIDGYRDGWAAEYVAIEARSLAPKPTTVDFVEAAAIPQAGLTSWQALFDHGHLESGQTVVIHGAGGGVGSMGVQLARWAGAHVMGRVESALVSACSSSAPMSSWTSSGTVGRRRSVPSILYTTPSAATCSPIRRRS